MSTKAVEKKAEKTKKAGNLNIKSADTALPGTDKKYIRTIRILAFLIPFAAVLIGMLAGSFAPFGGKDVMTSGGMSEHLTYYYELYDRVHGGDSLVYSLTSGNGYDFSTVFTYYLSDPLNLLILVFPRMAILAVINILYAFKLGLAGLFMSIFLTRRKARIIARKEAQEALRSDAISELNEKKRIRKEKQREKAEAKGKKEHSDFRLGGSETPKGVIGTALSLLDIPNLGFSVAFALSAYMVGQGLDVSHLSVVVLFPLILMALDNLLENGSWKLYAALMTASVFCSFYMTIIVFIFSIIYTAVYDYSDIHHALRNILLKLISDILAAGAGMVIILNSMGSSFFQKEISTDFPYGGIRNSFFDVLKALFPKTAPSSSEYYGYGIDIFCGIITVFLLILYVGNPNISVRRRISQSSIMVILTTGLIFFTPNYIFNGFFYSDAALSVFGFIFVAQLISMAYEALLNIDHTPVWQIISALAVLASMIALTPKYCDGYSTIQPVIYAMEFLAVGSILILLYRSNSMTRRLFLTLLPLSLMAEICLTYVENLRVVGSESYKYSDTLDSRMYETSRLIHEKNANARILFCHNEEEVNTPVINTLLGYDFVLAPEGMENVDSLLEPIESVYNVQIYKNPYTAKGILAPTNIAEWDFAPDFTFASLNNLVTGVFGGEQVFNAVSGDFDVEESLAFDEEYVEDPRRTEYYYEFVTAETADIYSSLFSIQHFGKVESGHSASFIHVNTQKEYAQGNFNAEFAGFNDDTFKDFTSKLQVAEYAPSSAVSTLYHTNLKGNGYLIVPLRNGKGLSVRVNGSPVKAESFLNDSAVIVPLSEGENTIEVNISPVLFYWGIAISLLFLLVLIFLAVKDKIKILATGKGINSVSEFIRDNYVYFITFGIATLIFIIIQMYTSSNPFGTNATLVGDGYVQAFNGYSGIMNDTKNGNWGALNWNIGIALDRYNDYSASFLSPWSYLTSLLMPESMYLFTLTFSYYLSFVSAGLYLILYLTHRRGLRMDKKDWRLIVLGTAYTLCSFNISFFIYAGFGFLTTAPLILLGMEMLIYEKKPFLYMFILFGKLGDAYAAFLLCEFIFLYFFTMHFESIKDFFIKGIRILIASVATALLACFRLIPYYLRAMDSPYKAADSVSSVSIPNGSYLSLVSDSMSFHEPVVVTDNDFKANIYIGILLLFCIPLYLINKRVKLSIRIRRSILAALLFLSFGNSTLNYILHGFHYQANVPNRFAAFFILLLVVMFYDILISIRDYSAKTVGITIGASAAVLVPLWIWAYSKDYVPEITLIMTLIFAGTYILLAGLQLIKKHRKTVCKAALAILLLELTLSALYSFRYLGHNAATEASSEDIRTLTERHPDMKDPFTATEIIGDKSDNRAESTDIRSISVFSSFMTTDHIKQFNRWNLLSSSNYMYYLGGNPLADMLLHIKYHISNDYVDNSWSHYEIIDETNNLTLHENPYFLPLGVFFRDTEAIKGWSSVASDAYSDNNGRNCFLYQNAFMHAMGYGDLYSIIEPETDEAELTNGMNPDKTYIMADRSAYLSGESDYVPVVVYTAKDVEGDVYVSYNNSIFYIGTAVKGETDELYFTMEMSSTMVDSYIRLAVANYDEIEKLHTELNRSTMSDISTNGSTITGMITAPEDGIVYLSLPDMKGWQCYVDGKAVDHMNFLNGVGIKVSAGDHDIRITYTPQGMWLGIGISVGTLILVILYIIFIRKKCKKQVDKA